MESVDCSLLQEISPWNIVLALHIHVNRLYYYASHNSGLNVDTCGQREI